MWRAHLTPSGREFYFNEGTKETTWVKPEVCAPSRVLRVLEGLALDPFTFPLTPLPSYLSHFSHYWHWYIFPLVLWSPPSEEDERVGSVRRARGWAVLLATWYGVFHVLCSRTSDIGTVEESGC